MGLRFSEARMVQRIVCQAGKMCDLTYDIGGRIGVDADIPFGVSNRQIRDRTQGEATGAGTCTVRVGAVSDDQCVAVLSEREREIRRSQTCGQRLLAP